MKHVFCRILILALLVFKTSVVFTQNLIKVKLSKKDTSNGVVRKYEYKPRDSHDFTVLMLFKNGKYYYEEKSLTKVLFNEGNWKLSNGVLDLTDNLNKVNLPVGLICMSKSDTANSFKIQIIRNLKGEYLTDGFVYINNDSNQCLPLTGTCLGEYENIDSIKVVFENGFKSKWIPVPCRDYKQLLLILQTELLMSTYTALRNNRFQVFKSYLKPKE